jgi:hydrogenase-4 membrane subunit HyfE
VVHGAGGVCQWRDGDAALDAGSMLSNLIHVSPSLFQVRVPILPFLLSRAAYNGPAALERRASLLNGNPHLLISLPTAISLPFVREVAIGCAGWQ